MIDTLEQLYLQQLHDLYGTETQLCEALPRMAKAATHKDLKNVLRIALEQSRQRQHCLDQILTEMGHHATDAASTPMEALIKASDEMASKTFNEDVRDAGLIATAQHIVHYQAAGYGTVVSFAIVMKRKNDRPAMETSLRESREASELLSQIATRTTHRAAAASYQAAS